MAETEQQEADCPKTPTSAIGEDHSLAVEEQRTQEFRRLWHAERERVEQTEAKLVALTRALREIDEEGSAALDEVAKGVRDPTHDEELGARVGYVARRSLEIARRVLEDG